MENLLYRPGITREAVSTPGDGLFSPPAWCVAEKGKPNFRAATGVFLGKPRLFENVSAVVSGQQVVPVTAPM